MKGRIKKIFHDNKKTFGKYLITGSATLAVNNLALALILVTLDIEELYSVILSAVITVIFGFIVNSLITFKSKMKLWNFVKYTLLAGLNIVIIKFTTVFFLSFGINVFVITILNTTIIVPINYLAFKYIVFK